MAVERLDDWVAIDRTIWFLANDVIALVSGKPTVFAPKSPSKNTVIVYLKYDNEPITVVGYSAQQIWDAIISEARELVSVKMTSTVSKT